MVAQHKEQLDAIKKNIDSLQSQMDSYLGENYNYGDPIVETPKPKMTDLFKVLRGGKA